MAQVEDLLGRIIETGTDTANFIKEIAANMRGAVGPGAQKSPVVEKLEKLISGSEKRDEKIIQAVKDLPDKITKPIVDAINQVERRVAEKAALGGVKGGGGAKAGLAVDKKLERSMLQGDKASSQLYDLLSHKGTGQVHDFKVFNVLRDIKKLMECVCENTGRLAEKTTGKAAKAKLAVGKDEGIGDPAAAAAKGGAKKDAKKDACLWDITVKSLEEKEADKMERQQRAGAGFEKIMDAMRTSNEYADNFQTVLNTIPLATQSILKDQEKGTAAYYEQNKALAEQFDHWQNINVAKLRPKDLAALHMQTKLLAAAHKRYAQAVAKSDPLGVAKAREDYAAIVNSMNKIVSQSHVMATLWDKIGDAITGFVSLRLAAPARERLWSMFSGITENIKSYKEFVRDTSRIGYYLYRATKPGNEIQRQMRSQAEDALSQAKTGHSLNVGRKIYVSLIKKGLKPGKDSLRLLQGAMQASTILGTDAEQTSQEYLLWRQRLDKSTSALGNITRSMQNVQARAGLFGDELLEVLKTTREITEEFRNSGLYAEGMEEAVGDIVAQAQITGTQRFARDLLGDLTKGFGFERMGPLRNLLGMSGSLGIIQAGQGGTAEGQRQITANLDRTISQVLLGGRVGRTATGAIDMTAFERLDSRSRARMEEMARQLTGGRYGIGELIRSINSMREAQKPTEQKLAEAEKRLQDADAGIRLLSETERKQLEEQVRQHREVMAAETLNKQLNALTQASEFGKAQGITMNQMLQKVSQQSNGQEAETVLRKALEQHNREAIAAGKKNLVVDVNAALKTAKSSKQGFVDVVDKLADANKTLRTAEARGTNAQDRRENFEQSIIEGIGSVTNAITEVGNTLHPAILMLGDIIWTGISSLLAARALVGTKGLLSGLFGKGGVKPPIPGVPGTSLIPYIAARGAALPGAARSGFLGRAGVALGSATRSVLAPLTSLTAGLGRFAALATGPVGLAITALIAGFGGIKQAFDSAANAAQLFGIAEKDVTDAHRGAATEAGFLTGILNTLSFGLFSQYLGPNGSLTAGLAKFFNTLGIFRYVLFPILAQIQILVGVFKIFWSILKVGWSLIQAITKPFMKFFDFVKNAIGKVFEPLTKAFQPVLKMFGIDMTKSGGELFSIFDSIADTIDSLGQNLEWISDIIWEFFLQPLTEVVTAVLEPIGEIVGELVDVGSELWSELQPLFNEIFGVDTSGFTKGIRDFFAKVKVWASWITQNIVRPFIRFFLEMIRVLAPILGRMVRFLIGLATLDFRKMGQGLKQIFWDSAKVIVDWLMGLPGSLISGMASAIAAIPTKIGELVVSGITSIGDKIKDVWKGIIEFIDGLIPDWLKTGVRTASEALETAREGPSGWMSRASNWIGSWFQKGGMVTPTGRADYIPIVAHAGEAVLNQAQQTTVMDAITAKTAGAPVRTALQMARTTPAAGPAAQSKQNKQIEEIADNTAVSAKGIKEMADYLEAILNLSKGNVSNTGTTSRGASTRNPRTPITAVDYFTWPSASFGDNPVKQYVNTGRSNA
jgi:hypothetical protein